MLSITMNHTGELFLSSPEQSYPLYKKLVLKTSAAPGTTPESLLLAVEESVLDEVGKYVGLFLDDNFIGLFSCGRGNFIETRIRSEYINLFISKIRNGITDDIKGRNVVSFELVAAPPQSV